MDPEKKSNGAFIGLVIIIIILVIGGIYIWMSNKNSSPVPAPSTIGTITDQDAAVIDALDTDIENTDTNIGVDVNAVN